MFIVYLSFSTLLAVAQEKDFIRVNKLIFAQSYTIPADFFINPAALDKDYKSTQAFKGIKGFQPKRYLHIQAQSLTKPK